MALVAVMAKVGKSSLVMVPVAVAVVMVAPLVGLERVMVKFSSGSMVVSPLMLMVMVFEFSPSIASTKIMLPDGRVPPKSVALAGFMPVPVTDQSTLLFPIVELRVTVKVKAFVPLFPSL